MFWHTFLSGIMMPWPENGVSLNWGPLHTPDETDDCILISCIAFLSTKTFVTTA